MSAVRWFLTGLAPMAVVLAGGAGAARILCDESSCHRSAGASTVAAVQRVSDEGEAPCHRKGSVTAAGPSPGAPAPLAMTVSDVGEAQPPCHRGQAAQATAAVGSEGQKPCARGAGAHCPTGARGVTAERAAREGASIQLIGRAAPMDCGTCEGGHCPVKMRITADNGEVLDVLDNSVARDLRTQVGGQPGSTVAVTGKVVRASGQAYLLLDTAQVRKG